MNYIYKNLDNKEKLNDILDKYKKIVTDNKNTSEILLLVPNKNIRLLYYKKMDFEITNNLNITTYNSFINRELIKYWPIVCDKCEYIKEKNIRPYFISSSLSEYIIQEKVNKKREDDEYFNDITSSNYNISNSILFNLNKALQSNFYFEEIGNRIYNCKKNKDKIMRFSYSQMNEIINEYIHETLNKGAIDYSLAIYLYNEYLLNDEVYINSLKSNIKYLIVDSLENSNISEVDFITKLLKSVNDAHIYFNSTKDYASFNNIDIRYIKQKLYDKCTLIENDNIENATINLISKTSNNMSLKDSYQLHSEMVEGISKDIINLIKDGEEAKDIAIISPINDITLDYQLQLTLKENNIDIYNTKKDKRIIDYPYAHALMVAIALFSDTEYILNDEDYINFYSLIFDLNKIQTRKLIKNEKYIELKVEITDYINNVKNLTLPEFLRKFYLDKLINLKDGRENIIVCKKLIEESEKFLESIDCLDVKFEDKKEITLIQCLKKNIKDYYSIKEIDEMNNRNSIILTTPYTYISSNMNHKIQIWVDIGSNTWNMKNEKELTNVHALKKSYKENLVYSDDMEEGYKRYYLYNTIYNLLKNCNEVYAYKSEYTINGYIQESLLYTLLLKLIDKGDNQ